MSLDIFHDASHHVYPDKPQSKLVQGVCDFLLKQLDLSDVAQISISNHLCIQHTNSCLFGTGEHICSETFLSDLKSLNRVLENIVAIAPYFLQKKPCSDRTHTFRE